MTSRASRSPLQAVLRSTAWAPLALVVACGGATRGSQLGQGGAAGAAGQGAGGSSTGTGGSVSSGGSGVGTGGTSGAGGSGASGAGGSGASGGTSGAGGSGASGGASGACTSSSDCPSGDMCGYAEAAGCSAQGHCFPLGPQCNAFSPGCACDGTTINIVCTGLPNGYVSAPFLHAGVCEAPDAGTTFACGPSLTCDASTQYCSVTEGGPCCHPPSYSCQSIPSSCANNRTCGCIRAAVGAQGCSESGGGVTVTFEAP
jgi:hypothetical protein